MAFLRYEHDQRRTAAYPHRLSAMPDVTIFTIVCMTTKEINVVLYISFQCRSGLFSPFWSRVFVGFSGGPVASRRPGVRMKVKSKE